MAPPWARSIHAQASQLFSNSFLFDKTAAFAFPCDSSPECLVSQTALCSVSDSAQ